MAIDLTNARLKVESFMTETCDVYAPQSVHTATINPVTLKLEMTAATPLYADGPCKIKDQTSTARGAPVDAEGGNQLLVVVTTIDFPMDQVPDGGFPEGSLVVCKSALRMPQLVGAEYLIRQSVLKTFGIQYRVLAERRKRVDP